MKSYNLVEGAVQDITLANDSYTEIFGFLVTMDNGEESSVRVSPRTGKVINWSNHNEFLDK